tara:strand:- start:9986 stop:10354 length:369 start_codon:yes stop_codon:yes gene_type:complete
VGHGPPYLAVVSLCVTTATEWRVLRPRIPGDPMGLAHLHALLDYTEAAILDGKTGTERDQYWSRMYGPAAYQPRRPAPAAIPGAASSGRARRPVQAPPPGFEPHAVAGSWRNARAAIGGKAR